jgi:arginine decarboxylase
VLARSNINSVQEILGSAHNLFGAINVIHVRSKASGNVDKANNNKGKGQYSFERIVWGQTTKEVLHSIRHNVSNIIEDIEREAESAVSKGCLSIEGAKILLENYKCSLDFYTYLSK